MHTDAPNAKCFGYCYRNADMVIHCHYYYRAVVLMGLSTRSPSVRLYVTGF